MLPIRLTRIFFGLCDDYNLDMLILGAPISVGGIGIFIGLYFAIKHIPESWIARISETYHKVTSKIKGLVKIKKA